MTTPTARTLGAIDYERKDPSVPFGVKAIRITVYGKAAPAGSKRAFMRPGMKQPIVVDANKAAKPWKQEVAAAAREVYQGALLDGPLAVRFVFYRPRPQGHFKKDGTLKAEGERAIAPTARPDVLKLSRGVEDALTGVIWRDDAQIVTETLEKRWGEPARCEIEIETLAAV